MGVVSSSLVITHRLYHIANMTAISLTRAQRRRNIIVDLSIGIGIPLLAVALCESASTFLTPVPLLTPLPAF